MKPYEVFEPSAGGVRSGRVATIRFLSGGRVHLNAEAGRLLGAATHVQLLFDREAGALALNPTTPDDPRGFLLTRGTSQTVLSAAAFQQAYEIPVGPKMRLDLDGVMLVAKVPEDTQI